MNSSEIKNINALSSLQFILFGGAILFFGRSLFIPLSFALLISFILYPVCSWLEKKGTSRVMSIAICITGVMIFMIVIIALLIVLFMSFMTEWNELRIKLDQGFIQFEKYLNNRFNISHSQLSEWLYKSIDSTLLPILKTTLISSGTSLVLFLLIPIYAALILYYRSLLAKTLYSFFSDEKKKFNPYNSGSINSHLLRIY